MSKLSVVLPAYNEELMVGKTCRVLAEVLTEAKIPYELVVVNDGSGDRTWEEIQKAGERDANVTGVLFSRNFGKEAAIFAGLAQACGDVVAVMDSHIARHRDLDNHRETVPNRAGAYRIEMIHLALLFHDGAGLLQDRPALLGGCVH